MVKYLFKLIAFLSIAAILLIVITVSTDEIIRRNADFKFDSSAKYFIFGASISRFAYNDSIIDNFNNLASPGEPFFYTYPKIKEIIKRNKSISIIFIDFSNGSIDMQNERRIWDEPNMQYRFPTLSFFLPLEDHFLLLRKNPVTYLKLTGSNLLPKTSKILSGNYKFTDKIGGYEKLDRYLTDSVINDAIKSEFNNFDADHKTKLAHYNIHYLEKIINLCNVNGVRVILIRSPLHKLYPLRNNEPSFMDILTERFSKVEFLDLVNFELDNSEFADLLHLNTKGARRYSIWFDNLLKSGLLDGKINQDEINRKIELENTQNSLSP